MVNGTHSEIVQQYLCCLTKAQNNNLKITVLGSVFIIEGCGNFYSVNELFSYLCGYERGLDAATLQNAD